MKRKHTKRPIPKKHRKHTKPLKPPPKKHTKQLPKKHTKPLKPKTFRQMRGGLFRNWWLGRGEGQVRFRDELRFDVREEGRVGL